MSCNDIYTDVPVCQLVGQQWSIRTKRTPIIIYSVIVLFRPLPSQVMFNEEELPCWNEQNLSLAKAFASPKNGFMIHLTFKSGFNYDKEYPAHNGGWGENKNSWIAFMSLCLSISLSTNEPVNRKRDTPLKVRLLKNSIASHIILLLPCGLCCCCRFSFLWPPDTIIIGGNQPTTTDNVTLTKALTMVIIKRKIRRRRRHSPRTNITSGRWWSVGREEVERQELHCLPGWRLSRKSQIITIMEWIGATAFPSSYSCKSLFCSCYCCCFVSLPLSSLRIHLPATTQ